jgi:hypothetical protein
MNKLSEGKCRAMYPRLAAAGCPLSADQDPSRPVQVPGHELNIRQVGDLISTRAIELDCGATVYTIDLQIVSDLPGVTTLFAFALDLPWEDPHFYWLSDPIEANPLESFYRVPGCDGLEYGRELVLNHRVASRGTLRRGNFLEGLLLGFGGASLPEFYRHGSTFAAKLVIFDQFDHRFESEVTFWTDRMVSIDRAGSKKNRPSRSERRSILDQCDGAPRESIRKVS